MKIQTFFSPPSLEMINCLEYIGNSQAAKSLSGMILTGAGAAPLTTNRPLRFPHSCEMAEEDANVKTAINRLKSKNAMRLEIIGKGISGVCVRWWANWLELRCRSKAAIIYCSIPPYQSKQKQVEGPLLAKTRKITRTELRRFF